MEMFPPTIRIRFDCVCASVGKTQPPASGWSKLGGFGTAEPLLNPSLELRNGDGDLITGNDNWQDQQQTEVEARGLAPSDERESAILQTLTPGSYTAIVSGVNDTTGVALVEVYNLANTL